MHRWEDKGLSNDMWVAPLWRRYFHRPKHSKTVQFWRELLERVGELGISAYGVPVGM